MGSVVLDFKLLDVIIIMFVCFELVLTDLCWFVHLIPINICLIDMCFFGINVQYIVCECGWFIMSDYCMMGHMFGYVP